MNYCIGNGQLHDALTPSKEICKTLNCMVDPMKIIGGGTELKGENMKTVVRRLTPLECERLQGFPDGWTDIGEWTDTKGKKHKPADSPRYKALGNSIAVGYANNQSGFWMWLMKRISAQYERSATLGSLFDGIGGFPLAWEFYNGKGSARWASEIEEFPIAVTKYHFGEEQKEGTWIHDIHYGLKLPEHRCSICGEWEYSDTESKYCPNCGAYMKGE